MGIHAMSVHCMCVWWALWYM